MSEFRRRLMMGAVSGGGQLPAGYILNQKGTITSPVNMITPSNDCDLQLASIRAATHGYVCYLSDGVLQARQLSDSDFRYYANGDSVSIDSTMDYFIKLPEFWWSCKNVDNDADIVEIAFSINDPHDDTWHHWLGNTFIGAFLGVISSNVLRSIPGVSRTETSFANHKAAGLARGAGYSITTYEVHQMMCILCAGYYHTLRPEAQFSNIANQGTLLAGGMTDVFVSNSANAGKLWGIECWDGPIQWIGNIADSVYNGNVVILNRDGTTKRTSAGAAGQAWRTITKMRLGAYADFISKATAGSDTVNYYVGSGRVINANNGITPQRCAGAGHVDGDAGGWSTSRLNSFDVVSAGWQNGYARLEYNGPYTIINS